MEIWNGWKHVDIWIRRGKQRLCYLGKGALFLVLLVCTLYTADRILTPKYYFNNTWPTTSTYRGFYQMENDTVDVLFFGSSHAASNFSPQKLYDEYGICSYNLGCEQQNLLVSYYWLREALRFQSPKTVILDCYMLFPYNKKEALNTSEACTRKAMDPMQWSAVKREAVDAICSLDEKQSKSSYYFPNIRFHTRWTGLNEDDFVYSEMETHWEMKGFTALPGSCKNQDYAPFSAKDSEEREDMVERMRLYLDKIRELCEERGIRLILVKTPATPQTVKRYHAIEDYAEQYGLTFLDFNEERLYGEIGFVFAEDNADNGHGNLMGAEKITSYLGKFLTEEEAAYKKEDRQWADTAAWYENVSKDFFLRRETDLVKYLSQLKDERYVVLAAVRDEASAGFSEEAARGLRELGLSGGFMGKERRSYLAVASSEVLREKTGETELTAEGTLRKGRVSYEIQSAGYECGDSCSIRIGGVEYAKNKRGLNLVVYNQETKQVIDSVCFDTHVAEMTASR